MTPIQLIEAAGTIIATAGGLAIIFVAVKSKLPAATIQIQNDSIRALQEQNKLLKENVVEMTKVLVELKARVSVLETIPLQHMAENLNNISDTLNDLREMGKTNQALIRDNFRASTTTTTTTK